MKKAFTTVLCLLPFAVPAGDDTPADRAALLRAAIAGGVDAQIEQAETYIQRGGLNLAAAVYWFERAARQANTYAQNYAAVLYHADNLKEKGINQYLTIAYYWYSRAANSTTDGNDRAGCHAFRILNRSKELGKWNGSPST